MNEQMPKAASFPAQNSVHDEISAQQLDAMETHASPVSVAGAAVREAMVNAGLDVAVVAQMLHGQGATHLDDVLEFCVRPSQRPPGRRSMARLVDALRAADLHIDIQPGLLVSRGRRGVRVVRDVAAGAIFVGSVWLVIGGIISGNNTMAQHTSVIFTLGVLAVCLTALALLEAAHIAAVALAPADVSVLQTTHTRVHSMHRHIATKRRLEQYLAGRQAGVALVVFGVAEVTRTAGMVTVPGFGWPIPGWAHLGLQIGVPGAMMVLVVGQVAPQLLAARAPATLMNTWPMALAFAVTRGISKVGLATPASWMVRGLRLTERIPSAPRERFRAEIDDVTGVGIDTIAHTVTVGVHSTGLLSSTATFFTQTGASSHTAVVASTVIAPTSYQAMERLTRDGQVLPTVVTDSSDTRDATVADSVTFTETVSPALGVFEAGDQLRTAFHAVLPKSCTRDAVVVTTPTRRVAIRVVVENPVAPTPPARLTVAADTESGVHETILVPGNRVGSGSAVEFVAVLSYPAVGTVITLDWS